MQYIYGSGLLFAAFLLIAVSRVIMNRPGAERTIDAFGIAEAIALAFTGLLAFGAAVLGAAVVHDWSLASAIELVAALGASAAASAAAWYGLGRMFQSGAASATDERPVDPSAPGGSRRGRPTASGARRGKGSGVKRVA